jgi:ABC-type phosphate/phosphonate transport system substrate-binding protein
MYDLPEINWATDAWWRGLARHIGVDCQLERDPDYRRRWDSPDLVFSQTCGYPLTHSLRNKVGLIATPHYDAEGCEGPLYCSIVLAREASAPEKFRGKVAAYNGPDSMSGMLALKLTFAPLAEHGRFFSRAIETGSHLNSLDVVRTGEADVCAIDAVTLALARRYRPRAVEGLVEIARSPRVPGLPFITSGKRNAERAAFLEGLARAFSDPELAHVRSALLLTGYSVLRESNYETILRLEQDMEEAGGLDLVHRLPLLPRECVGEGGA